MTLARLIALSALTFAASFAHALTIAPYSATALAAAQKAGDPVAVHFHATWCSTCKAQDRAFNELQADPTLKLTVLQADYDTEGELKKQMKVRSQSTLIVFRGSAERARSSGDTQPDRLKALLKTAL